MGKQYAFDILGKWEHKAEAGRLQTSATIAVRPPIIVGEGFLSTVLGNTPDDADLQFILSTVDCSVFIGTSRREQTSLHDRVEDIKAIGQRIVDLANHPVHTLQMRQDAPFSRRNQIIS